MATTIRTQGVLYINGKEVENSFSKISKATYKLRRDLKKCTVGTTKFQTKAAELRKAEAAFARVNAKIKATRNELNKTGSVFSRVASKLGGMPGMFTMFSSVGGALYGLKRTTDELLLIADAITDVEKTSGLATEEVGKLWHEFSELDTRTSKMSLMKMAEIGGRLGIKGKDNLKKFTATIDQAYVALGDSFEGGLEAVTTKLGKMKNLFSETSDLDYSTAINSIGSALNELAAQGASSESNISDFVLRLGQLPSALKPSIQNVLGLGAAFEESGIDARIGASGFSRFMLSAADNIEAFSYSMNLGLEDAKELLNTKPEEFFIRFSEGMKGLDATETAKLFGQLKLNTQEIQKAVGAAGTNGERFRKMMELSAHSMGEATSLFDEASKKNSNSAAIWTKIGKGIKDFFTDGIIPEFFNWFSQKLGYITGVLGDAGDGLKTFRGRLSVLVKTLGVALVALVSHRVAMNLIALSTKNATKHLILQNMVEKIGVALKKTATGVTLLYSAAKYALSGNIARAGRMMKYFNAVTRLNPIGLLITAVMSAITAYALFSNKTEEATRQQKMLNDISADAEKQIIKEKNTFEQYLSIAKDETLSKEKRLAAMQKLKEIAPEYLKGISLETINTDKAKAATDRYIESLKKKAYYQAVENKLTALSEKKIDLQKQDPQEFLNSLDRASNKVMGGMTSGKKTMSIAEAKSLDNMPSEKFAAELQKYNVWIQKAYIKRRELITENEQDMSMLLDEQKKYIEEYITHKPVNPNKTTPDPEDEKNNRALSNEIKAALKAKETAHSEAMKARQKLREEEIAAMEEGQDKEIAAINFQTEKKVAAIQAETEKLEEEIFLQQQKILVLQEAAKNTNLTDGQRKGLQDSINNLQVSIAQKQSIIVTNGQREVYLEKTKQSQLEIVRHKYELKDVENAKRAFDAKITQKQLEIEQELSSIETLEQAKAQLQAKLSEKELRAITTLEAAKKALREQASEEVLKLQEESLLAQVEMMQKMLPKLTGEAAEKMQADLLALYEALNKVKNALHDNPDNEGADQDRALESVDILGFSAAQWEETFSNLDTMAGKMAAVGMAFSALGNAGQMYAQHQKNINDRELVKFQQNQDRKKKLLESQLNSGIISQEQYHTQILAMEAAAEAKKRELELKQAKAEKAARIFSIIGDTAAAVASALKAGPILGPILAGMVGALGVAQLVIVKGQQLPSYHVGGFTGGLGFKDGSGHEVAGTVHAKEYVIPEWLLRKPEVANVAEWLEAKRQGITSSYEEGGYTATETSEMQPQQYTKDDTATIALVHVLHQLSEVLEDMEKNGIDAFVVSNAQNGRMMEKAIREFKEIKEKNKR